MIATQPIDFRCGINGLTALIADALKTDPTAATSSSSNRNDATD